MLSDFQIRKSQEIAQRIAERGLSIPAIFFLELYKPLCGLCDAGIECFSPAIKIFCEKEKLTSFRSLFESREAIENIILEIEKLNK